MLSRRAEVTLAGLDLLVAALIALGVFAGLPARWAPVDVPAGALVGLHVAAAAALISGSRWGTAAATAAAALGLGLGALVVTALVVTASWLSGVYGPVGRGGALVLVLVAALVVPYLVVFPALTLGYLGSRKSPPAA